MKSRFLVVDDRAAPHAERRRTREGNEGSPQWGCLLESQAKRADEFPTPRLRGFCLVLWASGQLFFILL